MGVIVWGGAEYQHPLGERVRLRAGADLVQREYGGSDFDRTAAGLHLGPRVLIDPITEASVLATASREWSAGQPTNHTLGARAELRRRLSRQVTAQIHASWQERDYRTSDRLDGPLTAFSLGGSWLVSPTVQIDAGIGYAQERTEAESMAQRRALGAGGCFGGAAVWLHGGGQRRVSVDRLRRGLVPIRAGRQRAGGFAPLAWLRAIRARRGRADRSKIIHFAARSLTPFAWLRAIRRAARSRRPVCFAARSLSRLTPRRLPGA